MYAMKISPDDTRLLLRLMDENEQLRMLLAHIVIDRIQYKVRIKVEMDRTRIHITLGKKYPGFVCIDLKTGNDPALVLKAWFFHLYESEMSWLSDFQENTKLSDGIVFQSLTETQWRQVNSLLQMEAIRRVIPR